MKKKSFTHITFIRIPLNKIFLCLTMMVLMPLKGLTQQFNNWHFPANNAVTFNTIPISVITNSAIGNATKGGASISDKNGNLLFYSNGISVWNKNNQLMPNGFGLKGELCQINGILIIPFLNDTSKYYLFTSQGLKGSALPDTFRYSYSVVDMQLNAGLGDVTIKNSDIRGEAAEKMVAIPHANGTDVWWICRDRTNNFYSYKISCNGFENNNPVISNVGNNVNFNINLLLGDIKASSDGKTVAAAYSFTGFTDLGYFETYQFDNLTGILSNPIKIPGRVVYGVEFSPNSKILYISQRFEQNNNPYPTVTQYDINNYDSTAIMNSLFKVAEISLEVGLQLGPDNKIYAPVSFTNSNNQLINGLDVINNPNVPGVGCGYQSQVVSLPNQTFRRLPYSYVNLITNQNVQINYTVAPNCRTVALKAQTYIQGRNLTFKWQFGDGDSVIQNVVSGGDTTFTTVTHTYPPGIDTFSVSLTVTSDTVCGFGRAGKQVYLKPPPPTAKFGTNAGCGSLTIQFTDSTLLNFNPSITHQWAYRRAGSTTPFINFSVLQNPAFAFPAFDSFSVRLIVTSPLSCVASDTLIKTIRLKPKPIAAFTPAVSCGNKTVAFTNNSTVAADTLSSYHWRFGNEGSSALKNPSFTFTNFGIYTVKLSVTSSLGCVSDTFGLSVTVADKPVANILYNNNACANAAFNLSSNASVQAATINSYNWLLQGLPAGSSANISPVLAAGNYTVKHWVSSSNGCSSDTAQQLISVQANPVASINAPDGCVGTAIPFVATVSGNATTFKWRFGNGDSSNLASPGYTYLQPGNFNISYTASSSNGCRSDTATKNIVIETNPVVRFTTDKLCAGKRINFTSTASNTAGSITNYNWAFGNDSTAAISSAFTTFNRPGAYSVTNTATTVNGCVGTAIQNLIISNLPLNAGNDVTINQNTPYQLQGSGTGSYLWQPAQFLNNPTIANPLALLQKDQLFTLQLTANNGCKGFDSVLIKVLGNIFIPSAFSPNGDTNNDTWRIQRLADYPSAKLSVFNRYGQIIFEGNNNNGYAWDSRHKGKLQPTGAYIYLLLVNDGKANQTFKGTVMLVR